jgi:hypothetical protein
MGSYNIKRIGTFTIILIPMIIIYTELLIPQNIYSKEINNDNSTLSTLND